jgi:acetyl-CoA carboxylase biotin carboxyl carrier protein
MKEPSGAKPVKSGKRSWVETDDIRILMDLIKDTEVTELEVEKSGIRIRIKKSSAPEGTGLKRIHEPVSATVSSSSAGSNSVTQPSDTAEDKYYNVCSPIVGTFFRSPTPEKESYVNVGDVVKKGQILCIVEAMKLMNEIESEISGKIVEILVQDSQPVEYGEVLFKIEPV